MVRAVLSGTKTQTRRIVKPRPVGVTDDSKAPFIFTPQDQARGRIGKVIRCPYGAPGDRLWVRETWHGSFMMDSEPVRAITACHAEGHKFGRVAHYAADGNPCATAGRARPSIHMPRSASRITLEVVSVRVERLQEISEEDAVAEGALLFDGPDTFRDNAGMQSLYFPGMGYAQAAFRDLWDSINAKRAPWESNPWVWVIEFRRAA